MGMNLSGITGRNLSGIRGETTKKTIVFLMGVHYLHHTFHYLLFLCDFQIFLTSTVLDLNVTNVLTMAQCRIGFQSNSAP